MHIKDNNNSPHGKFHPFLFSFSSKFPDLNFTPFLLYVYSCSETRTWHKQWAWVPCASSRKFTSIGVIYHVRNKGMYWQKWCTVFGPFATKPPGGTECWYIWQNITFVRWSWYIWASHKLSCSNKNGHVISWRNHMLSWPSFKNIVIV